jgi:hypothetical protein
MPLPFRKRSLLWIVAYSVFCFFSRAAAQPARSAESPFAAPNLQQLIQQSGFIFAGTVTSVECFSRPKSGEITASRITFRVEQAFAAFARDTRSKCANGQAFGTPGNGTAWASA